MRRALQQVSSAEDWRAMHDIRHATLFPPDRGIVYDENHPLDRDPANQCFLLTVGGRPIGIVRIDRRGLREGVVRLVAIVPELQRQGHGRALEQLVEAEARRLGMTRLMLNARADAVGFYERVGWQTDDWDPSELTGIGAHS